MALQFDGVRVVDTNGNSVHGSPSDAAYAGAGDATVITALKGLYAKLGAAVLAAGSAVIGKVGLQVGGADVSASNKVPVLSNEPSAAATTANVSTAASIGDTTLVATVGGQSVKLHRVIMIASGQTTITFKNVGGSNLTGSIDLIMGTPYVLPMNSRAWVTSSVGSGLAVANSAAQRVTIYFDYVQS